MRSGPVLLCKHACTSKHDDLAEEVELLEANLMYGSVRHKDREHNVSLSDVPAYPQTLAPDEVLPAIETSSPPTRPTFTGDRVRKQVELLTMCHSHLALMRATLAQNTSETTKHFFHC